MYPLNETANILTLCETSSSFVKLMFTYHNHYPSMAFLMFSIVTISLSKRYCIVLASVFKSLLSKAEARDTIPY